jgi:pyruvate formate lyase activating enzyme
MKEAKFYEKLNNEEVKCRLCHHFCNIQKNKTGVCGVRKNKDGILYALNYGFPIAQNIDPVEKKPLFHFQPGSITYSLGNLGCNFKCKNCQNWEISQVKNIEDQIEKLTYVDPVKIVEEAIGNDCQSISYTYTEPSIFAEYALDIMKLARENELKNIWVSNGYMSEECLGAILPYLDAVNIDLKSMDENFYLKNCGAKLNPILENLKILKQEQVHVEIATLIIPGLSDDEDMLKKMADFIASELGNETPWHLSKFSPQISWQLQDLDETDDSALYNAHEIGKTAGLKYVYLGNMPGDQKENTYCPKCGELAIRRLGYYIERLDDNGLCTNCEKELDILE